MTDPDNASEHGWAARELPWYVNGTLSDTQRWRFEGHLRTCPECQADLAGERNLALRMRQRDTVEYTPHRGLSALSTRIEAQKSQQHRRRRLSQILGGKHGWAPFALAAQAAAMLVLAVAVWTLLPQNPRTADYRTMSDTGTVTADGVVLQIVFDSSLSKQDIAIIIDRTGGVVLRGPTEAGLFEIRLTEERPEAVRQIIQALRDSPAVAFVAARSSADLGQ